MQNTGNQKLSFWEHLDVLRGYLIKIILAVLGFSVLAFIFKDELFGIVLAPKNPDFITYKAINSIAARFGWSPLDTESLEVKMINTELTRQFVIHMKLALYAGIVLTLPVTIYLIFRFISPALYPGERRNTTIALAGGYLMFLAGLTLSYFIVFPFAFRFLVNYQVSTDITNLISLQSYTDTLIILSVMMGILFELPVVCWLLGKTGILKASFMKRYRRHAIVVILTLAAIITPTTDIFTLLITSVPIYLLYELSIVIVKKTEQQ